MLLNECMSKWHAVRGAPHVLKWNKIYHHLLKLYKFHDNSLPGFSPEDIKMLGWCPGGASLTSWGEGASLALVGHPSSNACFSLTYQSITSGFLWFYQSVYVFWILFFVDVSSLILI